MYIPTGVTHDSCAQLLCREGKQTHCSSGNLRTVLVHCARGHCSYFTSCQPDTSTHAWQEGTYIKELPPIRLARGDVSEHFLKC